MSPFLLLLFVIPGVIIFFLGRYIGNTGYVEVLKQYNEKKQYDKEGLTTYVYKLMTLTGGLTVITSIVAVILALLIKSVDFITIHILIYVIITLQYIIRLRFSCRKFEIKE